MLIFLLGACEFSAAGALNDSGAKDPETIEDSSPPEEEEDDTGEEEQEDPWTTDDDGDGWTDEEGDCDDTDPSISPAADDLCDGQDQDCDDEVDEDAWVDDPYEPNDEDPVYLGALEDDPEHQISARLHNDDDTDLFSFRVEDSWIGDAFPVTITLTNIPSDATYRLVLNRLDSDGDAALGQVDSTFGSGTLSIVLEDATGPEDGGLYEVKVDAIAGADCSRSYLLTVVGD